MLRGDYDNPSIIKINLVDEEHADKATFIFPDDSHKHMLRAAEDSPRFSERRRH